MMTDSDDSCFCGSDRPCRNCCLEPSRVRQTLASLDPKGLLQFRFRALQAAEFGLVYQSYHAEAPFLQHFPDPAEYLKFAAAQLGPMVALQWRLLKQRRPTATEAEVLCWMQVGNGPDGQELFELALLLKTPAGWRYHSGQKLTREDYRGCVSELDFCHFEQAAQKIRY